MTSALTCKELDEENKVLRELLWLYHGCSITELYGDDGEMQCAKCVLDFKRDSVNKLKNFINRKNCEEKEKIKAKLLETVHKNV